MIISSTNVVQRISLRESGEKTGANNQKLKNISLSSFLVSQTFVNPLKAASDAHCKFPTGKKCTNIYSIISTHKNKKDWCFLYDQFRSHDNNNIHCSKIFVQFIIFQTNQMHVQNKLEILCLMQIDQQ